MPASLTRTSNETRTTPILTLTGAQHCEAKVVVVLSVEGHPEFLVARSDVGEPRAVFIDEVVRRLYGRQPDGSAHKWRIEEEPTVESLEDPLELPGPVWLESFLNWEDWLLEKVNGC